MSIDRLLVANRGEIACRVFRTCRESGIETVAVFSEADAGSRHVREADRALPIGGPRPQDSYLRSDAVISAALEAHADAIHPGYGFLSESPGFAREVRAAGLTWVGPDPESMEAMADKVRARSTVATAGVPVVPGSPTALDDPKEAVDLVERIGYPVMVKASAGGGGFGMITVHGRDRLAPALEEASQRATRYFGSGRVYIEKHIERARHVEVQILGLPSGRAYVVGDRDCTVQRRHQKVLEEAPAPGLTDAERRKLHDLARAVAESVAYRGAGTIEMLWDLSDRSFYFLEMNTRLQVEHPVTELVSGIDLVRAQLQIAQGVEPALPSSPPQHGHAMEFRVYAEDPETFRPSPGVLRRWRPPERPGIRVDSGYDEGDRLSPYYDPLIAKLCAHGADRDGAISLVRDAAKDFVIDGIIHNLSLLERVLSHRDFIENTHTTSMLGPNV